MRTSVVYGFIVTCKELEEQRCSVCHQPQPKTNKYCSECGNAYRPIKTLEMTDLVIEAEEGPLANELYVDWHGNRCLIGVELKQLDTAAWIQVSTLETTDTLQEPYNLLHKLWRGAGELGSGTLPTLDIYLVTMYD